MSYGPSPYIELKDQEANEINNRRVCFLLHRSYYGNTNFFGGPSSTSVKASSKLKLLEAENEDAMFVFLSDVWLDQAEVLEKLRYMFSGRSVDLCSFAGTL